MRNFAWRAGAVYRVGVTAAAATQTRAPTARLLLM
jgi:hypothetical protein